MEKQNYKIIAKGISEIVEADRVEFHQMTGQTLFYNSDRLEHIAPADALIMNVFEETAIKNQHSSLQYVLHTYEKQHKTFWEEWIKKHKFFDAKDVPVEDEIERKCVLSNEKLIKEIREKLIKS